MASKLAKDIALYLLPTTLEISLQVWPVLNYCRVAAENMNQHLDELFVSSFCDS